MEEKATRFSVRGSDTVRPCSMWLSTGRHRLPSKEMRKLARQLPGVLEASRADSTGKKYRAAFKRWQVWAKNQKISSMPADPLHVALYLVKLMNDAHSPSPIAAALHGISWSHCVEGQPDPCKNDIVKRVNQAARRQLAKRVERKKPLSKDTLIQLAGKLDTSKLKELQTLTLVTLGLAGFLRWDDLARVYADEIYIKEKYMVVFLEKRKNDQFREGSWVFISRWSGSLCPVQLVEQLLQNGGHQGHVPLFGRVRTTNGKQHVSGTMSYSRARELFREALTRIGANPSEYGLHSLRSGGVSIAAAAGVPDRLIQRHGGWRSEKGMKCYFSESLPKLLEVSQALAI